jgi:hypothetical protein
MDRERLRRLERKVDQLTWLVRLQTVLLALIAVVYLLKISSVLLLILLVVVPLLILFNRSLPQWGRRLGSIWGWWQRPKAEPHVGASQRRSAGEYD